MDAGFGVSGRSDLISVPLETLLVFVCVAASQLYDVDLSRPCHSNWIVYRGKGGALILIGSRVLQFLFKSHSRFVRVEGETVLYCFVLAYFLN